MGVAIAVRVGTIVVDLAEAVVRMVVGAGGGATELDVDEEQGTVIVTVLRDVMSTDGVTYVDMAEAEMVVIASDVAVDVEHVK